MKDRMMSSREIMVASANLDRLESMVGDIPLGIVPVDEISDHILSSQELQRLAADITRINFMRGSTRGSQGETNLAQKLLYIVAGLFIIPAVFDVIFGTNLVGTLFSLFS